MRRLAGMLAAMAAIMASAPRGAPNRRLQRDPNAKIIGTEARRMARRVAVAERWREMFRVAPRDAQGRKVRVAGTPVKGDNATKRALLAEAQKANPAIRTLNGAKKLDQRLTREAKAVA